VNAIKIVKPDIFTLSKNGAQIGKNNSKKDEKAKSAQNFFL